MCIRIYPGQHEDDETGLNYNYHRYYNPVTGRYLTPDPIGLDGGINLYAYVGGNPVNEIDPLDLLTPNWHFGITYVAVRESGLGVLDSITLAWGAVAVDFGTQGNEPEQANLHAMAGRGQSREEAIEA